MPLVRQPQPGSQTSRRSCQSNKAVLQGIIRPAVPAKCTVCVRCRKTESVISRLQYTSGWVASLQEMTKSLTQANAKTSFCTVGSSVSQSEAKPNPLPAHMYVHYLEPSGCHHASRYLRLAIKGCLTCHLVGDTFTCLTSQVLISKDAYPIH